MTPRAFDEAKRVIERIAAEAARHVQPQVFTLLPFSHARRHRSLQNDLISYRLGNDFRGKLAETLKKIEVSQTDAGPAEALRASINCWASPRTSGGFCTSFPISAGKIGTIRPT